jgi:hypothetical protein
MEALTDLELGNQHLAELRAFAADASLVREVAKQYANPQPRSWRRTIGHMLISTGQRLSAERVAAPCPE